MTEAQLLKAITLRAHRILDRIGARSPLQAIPQAPTTPPTSALALPDPQPIDDHLILKGLEPCFAVTLSYAYLDNARKLKDKYQRHMILAIRRCTDVPLHAVPLSDISPIRSVYMSRYTRALNKWVDATVNTTLRRKKGLSSCPLRPEQPKPETGISAGMMRWFMHRMALTTARLPLGRCSDARGGVPTHALSHSVRETWSCNTNGIRV